MRVCMCLRYRVVIPREDFGEFLFLGGQARFTDVDCSGTPIFHLPLHVDAGVAVEITIGPHALGGTCIAVEGLQVRARVGGADDDEEEEDDDDDGGVDFADEPPAPWRRFDGGSGGAGGGAGPSLVV